MFDDLRNRFDFFIRSKTKFSRKNYKGETENPESDYVYDILSQFLKPKERDFLRVLDIGSKNWAYVGGEYRFFRQFSPNLELDGVEIDAYRLYSNLYSRYETAKFYTKGLEGVNYYPDDLLNISGEYDYIVWLLPFVTPYPLKRWGLPKKYFMPEKLLKHAFGLLEGEMFIVNQGEEEAEIQRALLEKLKIPYKFLGTISSKALEFKNLRYGYIIKKDNY